ncbi:MAG: cytochrome P450 [Steroidobacteraceae bacterium]
MGTNEPQRTSTPPEPDEQFDIGATDDSLQRMVELFARLGDTYRVYSPARRGYVYVINHPDDIKRVLVSNHRNYRKGLGLDRVRILLGNGIMTSEGEFWRRQRYMMQPTFHRRIINEFASQIATINDRYLQRWEVLARSGEALNITEEMSELTLDIVLHSIFGRDLERLTAEHGENPFVVVTREPARDLRFAYKFRSLGKTIAQLLDRRRALEEEHFDYVAMLMQARDKETGDAMSTRELIDEIMTLVVAGHETTASSLNWTWYLIAEHPQVEQHLQREVDAFDEAAGFGLQTMEGLAYTQQVINESLRLYPPGWLLSRRAIEDDQLGGFPIAAGTDVLLSPYVLHRHPRYWREPDAFLPERFDDAHEAQRPRFAYMPFAAGPRHCIGETFAVYEMLIHLCKAARRFRLRRADSSPIDLEAQVNLRTRAPLLMKLEKR